MRKILLTLSLLISGTSFAGATLTSTMLDLLTLEGVGSAHRQISDEEVKAISKTLIEVTNTPDERRLTLAVMKVESNFYKSATSQKGATGYMQIIPEYETEFFNRCNSKQKKVYLNSVNVSIRQMVVGVCQLLYLISTSDNLVLGLIAYNAGMYSDTYSVVKKGIRSVNRETNQYVTMVLYHYYNLKGY